MNLDLFWIHNNNQTPMFASGNIEQGASRGISGGEFSMRAERYQIDIVVGEKKRLSVAS